MAQLWGAEMYYIIFKLLYFFINIEVFLFNFFSFGRSSDLNLMGQLQVILSKNSCIFNTVTINDHPSSD